MQNPFVVTTNLNDGLWRRVRTAVDVRLLVGAVALFTVFVALFAYVQYGTDALAGNDGYYHVKMGLLIREQGLKPDFPWLPTTILNAEAFYDHHLLYHVYLALFASVDPVVDGGAALTQSAKIAGIILPALAFMAIWLLLRGQRVPHAWVWTLGLFAVSEAFLYRMSMPRAQSASLLVLALGLHWLLKERYWLLLPLGFAYVWLYNAFPLLVVVAGVYTAVILVTERRIVWQPLVFSTLGIGLGIIVNPYFPENVTFILNHLLPKLGGSETAVGNEWYPYKTETLLRNSGYALGAFVLGALALGWREKRMEKATLFALALSVMFGYMLFQSRRFVEYFPAFALIFAALSAGAVVKEWEEERPWLKTIMPLLLIIVMAFPLYTTLVGAREDLGDSKPADRYADASLWLQANAPAGSQVFQTDWDDFTRLFFYNTDVIYMAGLDPTYMELYDADLYDEWVDITRGKVDDPGVVIRDRFNADYVFTDLKHNNFLDEAADDNRLQEVYRDEYAAIFTVAP